ncbi:tyrosine-type recombinase/integrase [Deinococcus hopiensis]|uniref:Site-specific recombinase XerD n=1 Tax=Deinococcus hopiensis KR-140 TaxID=695939 RepID=A0A1W1VLI1_9DEIO|nr:site-specific integrase [Deinococcus hopiensis]SMB94222.1 Site-specific recombinase XerD [Deinococcus hopiensis KR-140]
MTAPNTKVKKTGSKTKKGMPPKREKRKKGQPYLTHRPSDGRWVVSVELEPHPDGRRHRPQWTFSTEEAANEHLSTLDVKRLQNIPRDVREMTVAQLLDRHIAGLQGAEYSTHLYREWIKTVITRKMGSLKVAELKQYQIRSFLNEISPELEAGEEQTPPPKPRRGKKPRAQQTSKRYAKTTCDKALLMLRAALREAVDDGLLDKNPAERVKPVQAQAKPRPEALTEEEIQKLVSASRDSPIFMIVLIGLATGARISEIVGLQLTDYDPATGRLRLNGTAKRQGGRGKAKTAPSHRVVHLPESIKCEVDNHLTKIATLKERAGPKWGIPKKVTEKTRQLQRAATRRRWNSGLPDDWIPPAPTAKRYIPLFPTSRGTPMCPNNVRREWEKILKACGLEHRNFHQTRATFITNALCTPNVTIKDVQDVVGHASPATTLGYLQSSTERQKKVVGSMTPVLGLDKKERASSFTNS